jgi:hypothetical protein
VKWKRDKKKKGEEEISHRGHRAHGDKEPRHGFIDPVLREDNS